MKDSASMPVPEEYTCTPVITIPGWHVETFVTVLADIVLAVV